MIGISAIKNSIKNNLAAGVILTLYITYAVMASVYLYVTHDGVKITLISILLLAVLFVPVCALLEWLGTKNIMVKDEAQVRSWKVFACFAGLCFLILMVWFIAFFPGSYQEDILNQIKQALAGEYDTWHPVWHTLLFFTIPLKFTRTIWSIVVFQIVWFSLALGYMCKVIYRHAGRIWAVIVFAYIMISPYTGYILMYVYKDVAFAIACMLAVTVTADAYMSGHLKDMKWTGCILLGFILANATLFRYNGVLFTAVFIVILFFHMSPARCVTVAATMTFSIMLIQGPVYDAVGTARADTEVIQTVGMPMSIIGNAVVETPELVDPDITEFAYSIAPREVWEERYARGNFNLMKYGGIHNQTPIEEAGVYDIFEMGLRCLNESPEASVDSWFALTDFVYGLDIQDKADIDVMKNDIRTNDYKIKPAGLNPLASLLGLYARIFRLKGFNIFRKLGFAILMLLTVMLSRLGWRSLSAWKRVLFGLPVLAYDFGTMLLLSGHDSRFFFLTFTIVPVLIIMVMNEHDRAGGPE